MGYDMGPDVALGLASAVKGVRALNRLGVKQVTAVERAYLARGLKDVASRNTIHIPSGQNPRVINPSQARQVSEVLRRSINAMPEGAVVTAPSQLKAVRAGNPALNPAPNRNSIVGFGSMKVVRANPRSPNIIHVPEGLAEGTYVYRLINLGDDTVYIGITGSHTRINAHALTKTGRHYQEILTGPMSTAETRILESHLIRGHMAFHGFQNPPLHLPGVRILVRDRLLHSGLQNLNRGLDPANWGGHLPALDRILNPIQRWRLPHPRLDLPPHPLQPQVPRPRRIRAPSY